MPAHKSRRWPASSTRVPHAVVWGLILTCPFIVEAEALRPGRSLAARKKGLRAVPSAEGKPPSRFPIKVMRISGSRWLLCGEHAAPRFCLSPVTVQSDFPSVELGSCRKGQGDAWAFEFQWFHTYVPPSRWQEFIPKPTPCVPQHASIGQHQRGWFVESIQRRDQEVLLFVQAQNKRRVLTSGLFLCLLMESSSFCPDMSGW